jgi:hypothetical protein
VVEVRAGEVVEVTVAQCRERAAVPCLALPSYLGELDRAEPVGQRREQPTGLDLRQLPIVADEHQLAPSFFHRLE